MFIFCQEYTTHVKRNLCLLFPRGADWNKVFVWSWLFTYKDGTVQCFISKGLICIGNNAHKTVYFEYRLCQVCLAVGSWVCGGEVSGDSCEVWVFQFVITLGIALVFSVLWSVFFIHNSLPFKSPNSTLCVSLSLPQSPPPPPVLSTVRVSLQHCLTKLWKCVWNILHQIHK